jgi:propionate CoA-transferase
MEIDGEEYLFYKAFPIHVGIIRGTTADPDGNITMEKEALTLEAQAIAMAARNSGGIVIAQVERIAERGSLNPRQVKIPGIFVDCVVVAESPNTTCRPSSSLQPGLLRRDQGALSALAPMEMSERKIIARRAAMELARGAVVNLGIGMPEGWRPWRPKSGHRSDHHDRRARRDRWRAGGGLNFGAAVNPRPSSTSPASSTSTTGRAGHCLPRAGPGRPGGQPQRVALRHPPGRRRGFINISQNAKKVVFVGTFTAGNLEVVVRDGGLAILADGQASKFVHEVEHRTFSGPQATARHAGALHHRALRVSAGPGRAGADRGGAGDRHREGHHRADELPPPHPRPPRLMDPRIFAEGSMHLRDDILTEAPRTPRPGLSG